MDRQQHIELMRMAIEHPEFIEVLDARSAMNPYAREELFANLMMMYWLAVWELGVVDEFELRAMADLPRPERGQGREMRSPLTSSMNEFQAPSPKVRISLEGFLESLIRTCLSWPSSMATSTHALLATE